MSGFFPVGWAQWKKTLSDGNLFGELAAMTGWSEARLGDELSCDERTVRRYLRGDTEIDEGAAGEAAWS